MTPGGARKRGAFYPGFVCWRQGVFCNFLKLNARCYIWKYFFLKEVCSALTGLSGLCDPEKASPGTWMSHLVTILHFRVFLLGPRPLQHFPASVSPCLGEGTGGWCVHLVTALPYLYPAGLSTCTCALGIGWKGSQAHRTGLILVLFILLVLLKVPVKIIVQQLF